MSVTYSWPLSSVASAASLQELLGKVQATLGCTFGWGFVPSFWSHELVRFIGFLWISLGFTCWWITWWFLWYTQSLGWAWVCSTPHFSSVIFSLCPSRIRAFSAASQLLGFLFVCLFVLFHLAVPGLSCSLGIFRCGMQTLRCSIWDLVPWPGIKPGPPALGVQSLSHWTTREVPP